MKQAIVQAAVATKLGLLRMARYFHATAVLLEPGSVILPGKWGFALNAYRATDVANHVNNAWTLLLETVFESVRAASYPSLPSRMTTLFACPTLYEAQVYLTKHNKILDLIYEVEPVDAAAPVHIASYALPHPTNLPGPVRVLETLWQAAEDYWKGNPSDSREVLIGGAVRVIAHHPYRFGDPLTPSAT